MKLVPLPLTFCLATLSAFSTAFAVATDDPIEATAVDLGGGSLGSVGEPLIGYHGSPVVGRPLSIVVTRGAPGAFYALGVSAPATPVPLPEFGAVAHPMAPYVPFAMSFLDGNGHSQEHFHVEAVSAALAGVPFTVQALVADSAAFGGVAFTDGLALSFGEDDLRPIFHRPWHSAIAVPHSFTSADFNADGILDYATANGIQATISIVLGEGLGRFADEVVHASVPGFAFALDPVVTTGDFDGDGEVDIVQTCAFPNSTLLYRGLGGGALSAGVAQQSFGGTTHAHAADLDADGFDDLVTATSKVVHVRLADGFGGFDRPSAVYSVSSGLISKPVVVDVNADGREDIVVGGPTGLLVGIGDGLGGFGTFTLASATGPYEHIAVGLVDGDLHFDVVGTSTGSARTLLGDGLGGFANSAQLVDDSNFDEPQLVDVDGDGNLDLFASLDRSVSAVHFGDGTGAFDPTLLVVDTWADGAHVADFDGDGTEDLLTPRQGGVVLFASEGRGAIQLGDRHALGVEPRFVEVADFDGNGEQDVLVYSAEDASLAMRLGVGNGDFTPPSLLPSVEDGRELELHDQDGDGDLDAFIPLGPAGGVALHRGNSIGEFEDAVTIATDRATYGAAFGDLNRDGIVDMVGTNYLSSDISIAFGQEDGSFASPHTLLVGTEPTAAAIGNLDDDAQLEIVVTLGSGLGIVIVEFDGESTFTVAETIPTSARTFDVVLEDLNGDDRLDMITANHSANGVEVRFGVGESGFVLGGAYPVLGATGLTLGDFDGDARADVLARCVVVPPNGSLRVALLVGDGFGGFTMSDSFGATRDIAVGDMDGNGMLDIVTCVPIADGFDVLLNQFVE